MMHTSASFASRMILALLDIDVSTPLPGCKHQILIDAPSVNVFAPLPRLISPAEPRALGLIVTVSLPSAIIEKVASEVAAGRKRTSLPPRFIFAQLTDAGVCIEGYVVMPAPVCSVTLTSVRARDDCDVVSAS